MLGSLSNDSAYLIKRDLQCFTHETVLRATSKMKISEGNICSICYSRSYLSIFTKGVAFYCTVLYKMRKYITGFATVTME